MDLNSVLTICVSGLAAGLGSLLLQKFWKDGLPEMKYVIALVLVVFGVLSGLCALSACAAGAFSSTIYYEIRVDPGYVVGLTGISAVSFIGAGIFRYGVS